MPSQGHRLDSLKARRESAGLSVAELARRANLTDLVVLQLENGGNCVPEVTQRLLDVLGAQVSVTSSSVANPSQITTATHTYLTNDTVTIAGHTGSTPSINGDQVITKISGTVFSIPVNVTGGGTGGTATLAGATLGLARL